MADDDKTKSTAPAPKVAAKDDTKAEAAKATTEDSTPSKAEKELADLGVDPRLDNRTGDQRPKLVEWPAKPQQVDGPEISDDWSEHKPDGAEAFASAESFTPAGSKSEGPHGLGPEGVTVGDEHGKPVEKN